MFKPNEREYRLAEPFQIEQNEAQELRLKGLPVVFNRETVLFEYEGIQYKEIIAGDALEGCDMSDFILNRNHGQNDSTVFARTKNGSLTFTVTPAGLEVDALLDPEDERHVNLYRDIQKGRIDKMSFAFTVRAEEYDRKTHTRTITKIAKLFDVSAVDFPAYNDTAIGTVRDFFTEDYRDEFRELEQARRRQLLIAKTLL